MILLVMGVSGCGKTTLGQAVAHALGWPFYDGDDFHPPDNIAKMRQGIPLTDIERRPWLAALHAQMLEHARRSQSAVVACSALKEAYRHQLLDGLPESKVIYLRGNYEVIEQRLKARRDHFMPATLLASQFAALEEPEEAIVVEVSLPVEAQVAEVMKAIR